MQPSIISLILVIGIFIYEKFRRPIVCERKINEYIRQLNGTVVSIQKLDIREETYLVDYMMDGIGKRLVVKFNLFYKADWR